MAEKPRPTRLKIDCPVLPIVRIMSSSTSSVSGIMSTPASKPAAKKVATKSAAPAAAAPAPVVAPVAEAPKKAAKKVAAPAAAAPVVVASTPVEAVVAAPAAPTTTLEEDLKSVTQNLTTLRETVAAMFAQVKKLDKRVHRDIKDARKRKRRAVPEGTEAKPRVPSIFERPTKITDELCTFLGKAAGTLMSRSEVTKAVNCYVKEKDLKNKHDIKPDAALKKLLAIPDGDVLTYFNLQRYLNRHYVKATPVA